MRKIMLAPDRSQKSFMAVFRGGRTGRHAPRAAGDSLSQPPDGHLTEVCKLANALRAAGVKKATAPPTTRDSPPTGLPAAVT